LLKHLSFPFFYNQNQASFLLATRKDLELLFYILILNPNFSKVNLTIELFLVICLCTIFANEKWCFFFNGDNAVDFERQIRWVLAFFVSVITKGMWAVFLWLFTIFATWKMTWKGGFWLILQLKLGWQCVWFWLDFATNNKGIKMVYFGLICNRSCEL